MDHQTRFRLSGFQFNPTFMVTKKRVLACQEAIPVSGLRFSEESKFRAKCELVKRLGQSFLRC